VASKSEPPSSRPVAEVNGVPIPERRVLEVAAANRARAEAEGRVFGEEEERVLRAASLDLLIEAELMVQAARQKGLTVSPEEVEAEIHAARARFDTDKEYAEYLQDAHLTEQEVREEAERRLLMNAYRRTILGQKPVTEEDARRYYEEHRSRFVEPEKARVANILIQAKPDDPAPKREAARKRAEEARRRALDGEDFARLAQEYSQHPTAARGGDLGFIPKGAPTIFPQFEEVVFSTPVGQVSEVFETPFGFNVLKVLEKKPAEQLPFEKVRAEVLVELGMIRDSEALSAHLASLKKAANIRILDPAYAMPKPGPRAGSPAPKPGAKAGSP
jgi:peptidyl-prolyl cis-trans isomerase C